MSAVVLALGAGCRSEPPKPNGPTRAPDATAATATSPATNDDAATATKPAPPATRPAPEPPTKGVDDTEVKPVYPTTALPPHPLAARLCKALHDTPAAARKACCKDEPVAGYVGDECVRLLSIALADGAVTIDEPALARCERAAVEAVQGCDWVRPLRTVPILACDGVVSGKIDGGAACRSELECAAGLHCEGLGPTAAGTCRGPAAEGAACGPVTDVLASVTAQERTLATAHPTCDGYCHGRRCVGRVAIGASCGYRAACGPDARCLDGVCTAGAESGPGTRCDKGSPCARGTACRDGTCKPLGKKGDACKAPFDCAATCVIEPGAESGRCAARCSATSPPLP